LRPSPRRSARSRPAAGVYFAGRQIRTLVDIAKQTQGIDVLLRLKEANHEKFGDSSSAAGIKRGEFYRSRIEEKTLEHALSESNVKMCPGLMLYDESGRALSVKLSDLGDQLFLSDEYGAIQLKCEFDGHDITDVIDPGGHVSLVANLVSGGFGGNSPIVESGYSGYVLGLRWLGK